MEVQNTACSEKRRCAIEITQKKYDALTDPQKVAFGEKGVKAQCAIAQSVSDRYIEYVESAKSAKEMIRNLENIFQRKSPLSKIYIVR